MDNFNEFSQFHNNNNSATYLSQDTLTFTPTIKCKNNYEKETHIFYTIPNQTKSYFFNKFYIFCFELGRSRSTKTNQTYIHNKILEVLS